MTTVNAYHKFILLDSLIPHGNLGRKLLFSWPHFTEEGPGRVSKPASKGQIWPTADFYK